MSATDADVAKLRRMINEPDSTTYSDDCLKDYIEQYPGIDEQGYRPFYLDYTTIPPTKAETVGWIPNYDLNYAAGEIWAEKASILSQDYDFSADGGNYTRSQAYEQAMKQSRYYLSRRKPSTIKLSQEPREETTSSSIVGNLPEEP